MKAKGALYLVTFLGGMAAGAVVALSYMKKNYKISSKDEDSEESQNTERPSRDEKTAEDKVKYTILEKVDDPEERAKYEEILDSYLKTPKEEPSAPYLIRDDEYSEFVDYTPIELVYYADGTVADEKDEVVENPEELLGKHFHEWIRDKEEIFIRNDERCCDYYITKDLGTYDEGEVDRPHIHVEE